jgi:hypothetical protein
MRRFLFLQGDESITPAPGGVKSRNAVLDEAPR